MAVTLRFGEADDADLIVRNILEAGAGLFEFLLDDLLPLMKAKDFLRLAVVNEDSVLRFSNAVLAETDGAQAGMLLCYPAAEYGLPAIVESVMPGRRLKPIRDLLASRIDNSYYVNSLVVEPAMRGQGIARLLLDTAAELAGEEGLPALSLHAWSDNDAAIGLYRKVGFEVDGSIPVDYRSGAETSRRDMLLMRATLPLAEGWIRPGIMQQRLETIAVIGLGYIGLPTATVLASHGAQVLGVDINPVTVAEVNQGRAHFQEADLDAMVKLAVGTGKLRAAAAPEPSDAFIIAVPTPLAAGNKPDISAVLAAARSIAPVLKADDLVIVESTSPVGTTGAIARLFAVLRPDLADGIHLAYCPERVLPGRLLRELAENDRVIGGLTPEAAQRAAALYRLFVRGRCLITTAPVAEMVKLVENAYRDVNIAFANEISLLCETLHIDVWQVRELANHHPRVNILAPGPGVGGHCIAIDPWFLAAAAPDRALLIATARAVNDGKTAHVIGQLRALCAARPDAALACLGLTYKANVGDLRESPSLKIAAALAEQGPPRLLIADPFVPELPPQLTGRNHVALLPAEAAVREAGIVALLVDHAAFRNLDPAILAGKIRLDTVGFWPR